jgi:hypothetical protein
MAKTKKAVKKKAAAKKPVKKKAVVTELENQDQAERQAWEDETGIDLEPDESEEEEDEG